MAEKEIGGNITLIDFDLDGQEMIIVKKMIGNCARKIKNFTEYRDLKVEMKIHQKNKGHKKYEFKASLIFDVRRADAEVEGLNPFVALNELLSKILGEVEHKVKK
jgi:hypothetical protein